MNLEVKKLYKQIADAKERIDEIRSFCPHTSTFRGNYEWGLGKATPADICNDCGAVIDLKLKSRTLK